MEIHRRTFLKIASIAATVAALPRVLFGQTQSPKIAIPDSVKLHYGIWDNARPRTLFKATSINGRIGLESIPNSMEVNRHGYLTLREDKNATSYALYAPQHGFERTGPWHLLRTISRREARRARFTIAAPDYTDSDLCPRLSPYDLSRLPPLADFGDWPHEHPASIIASV